MGNMPNIIDIDSYCQELSSITCINLDEIRNIVLICFANIYNPQSNSIDFTDATCEIEKRIMARLNKNTKRKRRM